MRGFRGSFAPSKMLWNSHMSTQTTVWVFTALECFLTLKICYPFQLPTECWSTVELVSSEQLRGGRCSKYGLFSIMSFFENTDKTN